MPRTAATVRQADIARALRALKQSGLKMSLEIASDGSIKLCPHEKDDRPKNIIPEILINKHRPVL